MMQLQVLILHFKRFLFGQEAAKLDWHVTHDSYTLNLLGVTYDLVGVLNHIGANITSGHYNFDAVCPTTRRAWRCSDDIDPWLLSEDQLCHDFETAYIHVWQKRPLPEEQANVEEQGLRATSDEQQRRGGLQANNERGDGTPIGNGTGSISTSDEQHRREGLQATNTEQQGIGGLQGDEEEQELPAKSVEQQRMEGLQDDTEEQGLPTKSDKQQRGRRLPASEEQRNGKLIGNCRGSISTTLDENGCLEEDEERKKTMALVEEREAISSIKKRSDEQTKRLRQVCKQIKKVEKKYPEITAKRPAKKVAERIRACREGQSKEEKAQEKAKDKTRKADERRRQSEEEKAAECEGAKVRMATMREGQSKEEKEKRNEEEGRRLATKREGQSKEEKEQEKAKDKTRKADERQLQSEEEKEQEKAKDKTRKADERHGQSKEEKEQEKTQDRQRKTAKRANIAVKPRDGLNAQLTLSGSFRVDTNHLGAMDEVRALQL